MAPQAYGMLNFLYSLVAKKREGCNLFGSLVHLFGTKVESRYANLRLKLCSRGKHGQLSATVEVGK